MYRRALLDEFLKIAEDRNAGGKLVWLTGRGGAGKSTMAKQLASEYDLVLGSDTGYVDPVQKKWIEPTPEGKLKIRQDRVSEILKAKGEGKRVLFEGAPGPVSKYPPELFQHIDEIHALQVPKRVLRQNVISRSKERGSWYDPVARADDMANFEKLYNNYDDKLREIRSYSPAPVTKIVPDYILKKSSAFFDEMHKIAMDQLEGGEADERESREFDPTELSQGIEEEMEHTHDPELAQEIAQDHLSEYPTYYSELERMEDSLKQTIRNRAETFVIDPSTGRLLTIMERDELRPGKMKIEIPGGGREEEESDEEAAMRETEEEAGVAIHPPTPLPLPTPIVRFGHGHIARLRAEGKPHVGEKTRFFMSSVSEDPYAHQEAAHRKMEEDGEHEDENEGGAHDHHAAWLPIPDAIEALRERLKETMDLPDREGHLLQDVVRIDALEQIARGEGIGAAIRQKVSANLSETSPTLERGPLDTLDRRTIRAHRKPNVRFLPTTTVSGKIVK